MATINAAAYLGRSETMGTVEIGRDANFIVLAADPLSRVEHLHRIDGVVRGGNYFTRADLDTLTTRVAANRGALS